MSKTTTLERRHCGSPNDAPAVSLENAEEALQQQLADLSLEEHEKILFDIHGLSTDVQETPEVIETKLNELEQEVNRITNKPAYNLAMSMNPSYVQDREFRLMFLTSKEFNVQEAAENMVNHFENKRMIYGDGEILGRDVLQSDLQPGDLDFLRKGPIQVTPSRDAAGRMVYCMVGFHEHSQNLQMIDMMRPLFWFGMKNCRDKDAQRNGAVWIMYQNDGDFEAEFNLFQEMKQNICQIIPCRPVGGHFCSTNPVVTKFASAFQLRTSKHERFRIRCHVGSPEEINFQLQTFGIQTDDCPMQKDGTWRLDWHHEWLDNVKQQEEQANTNPTIILPRRFDVLLGKTKRSLDHTGNRRLAHLCEMHYQQYCEASKHKKTEISDKIVSIVQTSGGRFLKWEDTMGWVEAEDLVARNKAAHTFRFLRARKQKQQKKQLEDDVVKPSSSEPVLETDTTSASEGSANEEQSLEKRSSPPPSDILMYNADAVEEGRRNRGKLRRI